MRNHIYTFIITTFLIFAAGCVLSSGTFVVTYQIDAVQPSIGRMVPIFIDLTQDSEYQKHKDNIEMIDAISLIGQIANLYGTDASTEIWISDNNYDSEDSVKANGTLVFETPIIPVGDTLNLDYAQGMSYIRNIDVLKSHIKSDGKFYLYGIASGLSLIAYHTSAVITITAGI